MYAMKLDNVSANKRSEMKVGLAMALWQLNFAKKMQAVGRFGDTNKYKVLGCNTY
jgi:hypothetical protein